MFQCEFLFSVLSCVVSKQGSKYCVRAEEDKQQALAGTTYSVPRQVESLHNMNILLACLGNVLIKITNLIIKATVLVCSVQDRCSPILQMKSSIYNGRSVGLSVQGALGELSALLSLGSYAGVYLVYYNDTEDQASTI